MVSIDAMLSSSHVGSTRVMPCRSRAICNDTQNFRCVPVPAKLRHDGITDVTTNSSRQTLAVIASVSDVDNQLDEYCILPAFPNTHVDRALGLRDRKPEAV